MHRSYAAAFTMLSAFPLAACGLIPMPGPRDVSIERVAVGSTSDVRYGCCASSAMRTPSEWLEVSFTTRTDLIDYTYPSDVSMNALAYFCPPPDNPLHLYVLRGAVYWLDLPVDEVVHYPTPDPRYTAQLVQHRKQRLPFAYHAFLRIKTQDYDLSVSPRDVCIEFRGGNELGMFFKSNTMILSKEAVAAALSSHLSSP